jgi:DNA-binding MarR family transcriptional regulator
MDTLPAAERADRLHELADLVHAVARQLGAPAGLRPGPCTPIEISVMRFVCRNPGASAGAAAKATLLPSSNFSRIIKGLVAKGLLMREVDAQDARSVRLHPTALARANMDQMRVAWSAALDGLTVDLGEIERVNVTLREVEAELARARRPQAPGD